jgi:pyruvate ferredoxin oxidoreductase alpha subunit
MDRSESFGAEGGPVFLEVRSALYDLEKRPAIINYIYGLGGADVTLELIRQVFGDLVDLADGVHEPGRLVYLGAR